MGLYRFGFGWIEWLVGPSERFFVTIPAPSSVSTTTTTTTALDTQSDTNGLLNIQNQEETVTWQSGVKLTECRFLAEVIMTTFA